MAAEQAERWLSVACASPGERARAAICPPNCLPGQDLAHELTPPGNHVGSIGGEPRPQPTDRRRGHRPDRALSSPVRQNAAAAIGVRPASTVLAYPERMA